MLRWMVMAGGAVALVGCADGPRAYPTIPELQTVADFSNQIRTINVEARTLLDNGFALVDRDCARFFDRLQRARQAGEFTTAQLAAIASAASAIMAIAGAGAPAIGYTAAGLGLASVTASNIQRFGLLTDFPDELQSLILDAQAAYKRDILLQAERLGTRLTRGDAYAAVVGYARLCTLPHMSALAREALGGAQVVLGRGLTPDQREALAAASRRLGFSPPLTLAEADALLRFGESGGLARDVATLREQIPAARLAPVLAPNASTPTNRTEFNAALAQLRSALATASGSASEQTGGLVIPRVRVAR